MKVEIFEKIIEKLDDNIRGAGDYDGVVERTGDWMRKYIDPIIEPDWRVLDVGCGDCITANYLFSKVGHWEGITKGIDYENNHDKFPIKNDDFHFLNYPDNSFDLVIGVNVLEHAYFPMIMLFEMYRVSSQYVFLDFPLAVGDGGIEASEDNPDHYFLMTRRMWKKLFYRVGFKIEAEEVAGAEIRFLLSK